MHAEYPVYPAFVQTSKDRVNGVSADVATPDARRSHARTMSSDSTGQKKSGKRKRGHPEDLDMSKINQNGDVDMTDVPALHSGLTGGINKLMGQRHVLPPSPDDSPNSPIKRSRRDENGTSGKEKARRKNSDTSDKANHKRTKHTNDKKEAVKPASKPVPQKPIAKKRSAVASARKRSVSPEATPQRKKQVLKAIEYNVDPKDKEDDSMALVKISHAPTTKPVASFLDCLAKGSDAEEGVSVWKALKRWKKDGGNDDGEKELWKRIKIRMNDRGELIICI
jgi:cell growth-regulating nucleolar protein